MARRCMAAVVGMTIRGAEGGAAAAMGMAAVAAAAVTVAESVMAVVIMVAAAVTAATWRWWPRGSIKARRGSTHYVRPTSYLGQCPYDPRRGGVTVPGT